ncbi:phosphoribosylaminoimidazolesuccinocarboxamide synthase [Gammaproteobacteria bacterium]|nr:phosphoribosylaminoimidazolesuccinocarboxamide synthase [SAR86 cluster bacterium]MDB3994462.1 phosphoribosylaminoimidazolesuccinocarboxamide synthase [Gammaproteobacteria bacterium]MDC0577419.1 phosphoribosylaminoimidazolesuccinocarboxamide synthase [Gammaproteobacteria bacterium]
MKNIKKGELITTGKAKSLYETNEEDFLIMHYSDDTSAFDGKKIESLEGKGTINNKFNAFIMEYLESESISTHFVELLNETDSLVKRLDMAPVECVVRNVAAGSICKRLGLEEGIDINPPTFEFFYKDDALGDPMINEYHIKAFGWATEEQVEQMQILTFEVNTALKKLFLNAGMILVDYKLEFGDHKGKLLLGDEFTPDGCRVWDEETREKLDKDRFRQGLGDVVESYQIMAKRLGVI